MYIYMCIYIYIYICMHLWGVLFCRRQLKCALTICLPKQDTARAKISNTRDLKELESLSRADSCL